MTRTTVGTLDGEPTETTSKGENDLGYCILRLPCPALQTEAINTNRPISFYFSAHILLSGTRESEHFLSFGDQIGSIVYIFALHSKGDALPSSLLCLDADYFQNWLFPSEGKMSEEPPSTAWGLHDT